MRQFLLNKNSGSCQQNYNIHSLCVKWERRCLSKITSPEHVKKEAVVSWTTDQQEPGFTWNTKDESLSTGRVSAWLPMYRTHRETVDHVSSQRASVENVFSASRRKQWNKPVLATQGKARKSFGPFSKPVLPTTPAFS